MAEETFEEFLENYKAELTTTINSIKCLFDGVLTIVDMLTEIGIFPKNQKELMLNFWEEKTGIKLHFEEENDRT